MYTVGALALLVLERLLVVIVRLSAEMYTQLDDPWTIST
jgi:hypothetical protein